MPYRQPIQDYFPRARIRLIVRLEDFGAPDTPDVPKRIPTIRKGSKDVGAPGALQAVLQQGVYVLVQPGTSPAAQQGGPQDQTTSSDGRSFVIDGIVPQQATWEVNGIRCADKLTATISLRDLPLDPRCLRACGVKYFLGCVTPTEMQLGNEGGLRPVTAPSLPALSFATCPDSYLDQFNRPRTNQRFLGWVDDYSMNLDNNPTITLDCTDNTRLFIDVEHPQQLFVARDKPIDQAIANYMASFPQFVGMGIEYRPHIDDSDKPVLDKILNVTAAPQGAGPNQGASEKVSVWDYLTDVCGMVGHIIFVDGTTVVIQRPRTLYQDQAVRPDDPYTGRVITGDGQEPLVLPMRLYGFGANCEELIIDRGYSRRLPTNFEIRCQNPSRKKTLVSRFPPPGTNTKTGAPNRIKKLLPGNAADNKYEVVRVWGIEDQATLDLIAQAHYEARNRNEFDISFKTKNLGSFGGDNLDPDLLDIREGDPIQIQVLRNDESDVTPSATQNLANASEQELVQLGFPADFAAKYVATRGAISLPNTFRVKVAVFTWNNGKGVNVRVKAINYVVASIERDLPDGQEQGPEDLSRGAPVTVSVDGQVG